MIALEFLKRIAPGLILAALFIGALLFAHHKGVTDTTERMTAAHELVVSRMGEDLAKARAGMAQQKADMERQRTEDMAVLANDFHEKEQHATAEISRLDAAVRDGAFRLRARFTCAALAVPASGGAQAGTSTPTGDAGQARGLRGEDARALVRMSDEADVVARQLSACQAIVRRDRGQ